MERSFKGCQRDKEGWSHNHGEFKIDRGIMIGPALWDAEKTWGDACHLISREDVQVTRGEGNLESMKRQIGKFAIYI